MIHKFINTMRHLNSPSRFERYLENIQSSGRPGSAGINEAKRDFDAFLRNSLIL